MFTSLELTQKELKSGGPYHYASSIPCLQNGKITFKDGLNVLYGMNGTGKSTILNLLAFRLAATQGGVSFMTKTWLNKLHPNSIKGISNDPEMRKLQYIRATEEFSVQHDGQPVLFCNPRQDVGLSGGGFDDDFFNEGIQNCMAKGSTGQRTMQKLDTLVNLMLQEIEPKTFYAFGEDPISKAWAKIREREAENKKKPTKRGMSSFFDDGKFREWKEQTLTKAKSKITKRIRASFPSSIEQTEKKTSCNDIWVRFIEGGEGFLAANIDKGQQTILIDEPESGLAPKMQARIWEILSHPKVAKKYQIIVASHSAFALGIPHANVIEMSPGYAQECFDVFKRKFG